jgi:hypothetical protein
MKTHTNGPWSANLNGLARDKQDAPQWTVGKSCECLVILPNRSTPEETEANARLIAAAPDLLAALQAVLSTYRTFRNVPQDLQEWTCIDDEAFEQGLSAIAKAKGGE